MSNYWKSKVLPKFKKFFDKSKKKGAAEVCKSFDKSKESLDKEIGEKGEDLNPKVVEIYRSSSTFIAKKLLKEPNEATVKGNPDAVQGVLQELVKAGFPGAQVICEAGTKFGPALLPGPVVYLFEKASVYLVEEPLPEEPKVETREVNVEDIKAETAETPAPPEAEPAPVPTEAEAAPPKEDKEEEAAKEVEKPAATTPPPAAVTEAAAAAEIPAPVVTEVLAATGVTLPVDDPPAASAAAEEPAATPPPPPPASAPAPEKTD